MEKQQVQSNPVRRNKEIENTALRYPRTEQPVEGQTVEIAPGVFWLYMPLPFALDHINLWLLKDGDGWTAVDTGLYSSRVREAWEAILPNFPLKRQIVTHFHPDHLGMAHWLQEKTGAPLWMTQGEYAVGQAVGHQIAGWAVPAMLDYFGRNGLDEARMQALAERGNSYRKGVPDMPGNFMRLFDGAKVSIDGHDWEVICGFGHSAEHASLYCAEQKLLISGDMLLPRITTNVNSFASTGEDDPLGWFLSSIDRFLDLPEDTLVLPSHGLPFYGIATRVAQLKEHHQHRCDELLAACQDQPQSACDLIPVLFSREITDAHQAMFAMGESIAHLRHLEAQGKVRRVKDGAVEKFIAA